MDNKPKKVAPPSAWAPGTSGNPKGRPKGPNKVTTDIKANYRALIENNLSSIQEWLERVAVDDPGKAFDMLMKISPFVVPRLTEEVGNAPIVFTLPAGVKLPETTESEDNKPTTE